MFWSQKHSEVETVDLVLKLKNKLVSNYIEHASDLFTRKILHSHIYRYLNENILYGLGSSRMQSFRFLKQNQFVSAVTEGLASCFSSVGSIALTLLFKTSWNFVTDVSGSKAESSEEQKNKFSSDYCKSKAVLGHAVVWLLRKPAIVQTPSHLTNKELIFQIC